MPETTKRVRTRIVVAGVCVVAAVASAMLINRVSFHAQRPLERTTQQLPDDKGFQGPGLPQPGKHEVGAPAPDFALPTLAGDKLVSLASFRGARPVVLLFGSLSCDVFCGHVPVLEKLHQEYQRRAAFLFVNIKEAGHKLPGLEFLVFGHGAATTPSQKLRSQRTMRAMELRGFTMPAVIDSEEGLAERAYDAWPLRLVVVDGAGKIALDLGRGVQHDWDFAELEAWLEENAAAPSDIHVKASGSQFSP
jgi:hypothetical protein